MHVHFKFFFVLWRDQGGHGQVVFSVALGHSLNMPELLCSCCALAQNSPGSLAGPQQLLFPGRFLFLGRIRVLCCAQSPVRGRTLLADLLHR